MKNLPYELKEHIFSYIPIHNCNNCYIKIISVNKSCYCSYICSINHHIIILSRIGQIFFFYMILNIQVFLLLIINWIVIGGNIFIIYKILNYIFCNFIINEQCCTIY